MAVSARESGFNDPAPASHAANAALTLQVDHSMGAGQFDLVLSPGMTGGGTDVPRALIIEPFS